MAVRACDHHAERDTVPIDEKGAFRALFAANYRGRASGHSAAGRFDDLSIDSDILEIEADHLVVRIQVDLFELGKDSGVNSFVAAMAQCRRRPGAVRDLHMCAAEDENLNERVENDPVGEFSVGDASAGGYPRAGESEYETVPKWVR